MLDLYSSASDVGAYLDALCTELQLPFIPCHSIASIRNLAHLRTLIPMLDAVALDFNLTRDLP